MQSALQPGLEVLRQGPGVPSGKWPKGEREKAPVEEDIYSPYVQQGQNPQETAYISARRQKLTLQDAAT